jgi:hypothetical protein
MEKFTLWLIRTDMFINWFLGFVLVFFPHRIERLLTFELLLPLSIWVIMGIVFLGFAVWQLKVVKKGSLEPKELKFAAFMALVPVVLLTAVLFVEIPLYFWARVILWVANIYMLVLGVWYLYLSRSLSKD